MTRSRLAVGGKSRQICLINPGRDRAWHRKRTQLQKLCGIMFVVNDRSDQIGAIKSVSSTAVIILKVVVQREWLPALECNRAVHAPAILQTRHVAAHLGELKTGDPDKTVRNVEVRWPIFPLDR